MYITDTFRRSAGDEILIKTYMKSKEICLLAECCFILMHSNKETKGLKTCGY